MMLQCLSGKHACSSYSELQIIADGLWQDVCRTSSHMRTSSYSLYAEPFVGTLAKRQDPYFVGSPAGRCRERHECL